MTEEELLTVVSVYLAKVVDHLKGTEYDDHANSMLSAERFNRFRSR
jgi:hypothetical protein